MANKLEEKRREKLRVLARVIVQMERGVYLYPDGRSNFRPDGSPVISKTHAINVAGWSENDKNWERVKDRFEDPYFITQCRLERARMDSDLDQILGSLPQNPILQLGVGLFVEGVIRLRNDPASYTTAQILANAPSLLAEGLKLQEVIDRMKPKTLAASQADQPSNVDAFNAFAAPQLGDMTPEQRERFAQTVDEAADARLARINEHIDALHLRESEETDVAEPADREPSVTARSTQPS